MNARPRALLLLLLLAASAALLPFLHYLTDDTFIHFQFAKHLVQGKGFSFNAGEPTYGATSPLWVLLLPSRTTLRGAGAAAIGRSTGFDVGEQRWWARFGIG